MSKRNLVGQRFGRLLVLHETGKSRNGHTVWHCRCDCGNDVGVVGYSLISGCTKSCGCYNRERVIERNTTHGMNRRGKRHPVYMTWANILQRCENPNDTQYKNYGARGIKVCTEWHEFIPFHDWAMANGWQRGVSIDRIDNNGNYEPDNCRWVTAKEQARNKRNNHFITFNGKTQTMVEWAEEIGLEYSILWNRIHRGWSIERAFIEPGCRK